MPSCASRASAGENSGAAFGAGFPPEDCAKALAHIRRAAAASALARIIYQFSWLAISMLGLRRKLCMFSLAATIIPRLCAESLSDAPGTRRHPESPQRLPNVFPISNRYSSRHVRVGALLRVAWLEAWRTFRCVARASWSSAIGLGY